jgi:hypothetical protein
LLLLLTADLLSISGLTTSWLTFRSLVFPADMPLIFWIEAKTLKVRRLRALDWRGWLKFYSCFMILRQGKTLHGGADERRRPPSISMTQVVVQKKVEVVGMAKNKHSEVT